MAPYRALVISRVFFFPPHLFPRLSVALTVLLGSLQAHDLHEGHEGQKSRAQVCLGRGGEATGGRRVWRGFRQELAPVDGIGVDVVEIGCSFAKKGGCEGGHGCMGQRGGPSCGESGRNALLEDGGCLSGSGSCQVVDEGGGLLTPSAPHLYILFLAMVLRTLIPYADTMALLGLAPWRCLSHERWPLHLFGLTKNK